MPSVFVYVVDRDFGFAHNPFHGYCTLATCKPGIRKSAQIGDWVIGMGGSRLGATGQCVFAMQITATISFDEYWTNPIYNEKKAVAFLFRTTSFTLGKPLLVYRNQSSIRLVTKIHEATDASTIRSRGRFSIGSKSISLNRSMS